MSSDLEYPVQRRVDRGWMRKRATCLLVLMYLMAFGSDRCPAQLLPVGARSMALGGITAGLSGDPEAIFHNPASLVHAPALQLSLFYQRLFGLPDVSVATASITAPLRPVPFGCGLYTFGNRIFRQHAIVVGAAVPLQWRVSSAVAIRYVRTSIRGYGAHGTAGLCLAMFAQPTEQLDLGFYVGPLNRTPPEGKASAQIQELAVGLGYHPVEDLSLFLDVFDDPQFEPDLRLGVEMEVTSVLSLRAGGALSPGRFSVGFGLRKLGLAIDYALFTHGDLGLTHQVGLVLSKGSNSQNATAMARATAPGSLETPPSIDINTATEKELRTLRGVGPVLAGRILAYRSEHGPFHSLEELLNVPGVGKQTLQRLRPFLLIGEEVQP